MTDASLYTGAHKNRFDADGKGKGEINVSQALALVILSVNIVSRTRQFLFNIVISYLFL